MFSIWIVYNHNPAVKDKKEYHLNLHKYQYV